jgi:hypothetical protein
MVQIKLVKLYIKVTFWNLVLTVNRSASTPRLAFPHARPWRLIIIWLTWFVIAFGLGYPSLNRYDARHGDPDIISYYKMVIGQPPQPDDIPFCLRVLVPAVARPFYLLTIGKLGSWSPVYFGLLVSNSIFTATAALFLFLVGFRLGFASPVALLGCTIFLLNFVVSNFWLSGLVDSSEGCLILAVAWCLLADQWWPLPPLAILCAMAKQSTLPFALIFAATWWLTMSQPRRNKTHLLAIAAMGIIGAVTLALVYRFVESVYLAPWTMAAWYQKGSYLDNIKGFLADRRFWYAFAWVLPLGVWRLNRLPRPWVMASLVTTAFALFMAVLSHLGGNVNRAVFNVFGPILSVSAAIFLADVHEPGMTGLEPMNVAPKSAAKRG